MGGPVGARGVRAFNASVLALAWPQTRMHAVAGTQATPSSGPHNPCAHATHARCAAGAQERRHHAGGRGGPGAVRARGQHRDLARPRHAAQPWGHR